MPTDAQRLLFGPYLPPTVQRGDHAFCLYRDCEVTITSWTDARFPWPKCIRRGGRAMPGPLVNETLLRAVETESSLAIQYWFGVSGSQVARWRRAFGIRQWEPPGSARLHQQVSAQGANAVRRKRYSKAHRRLCRERAKQLNLIKFAQANARPGGSRLWTTEELGQLGKATDAEVSARIGRSDSGVRVKRTKLGIPTALDRRRRSDEHGAK